MTNIYFNRWFSVSYHYMNMIRDNPDGGSFKFYGTHPDPNHLSLQACDYSEREPVLHGTEYVDYAVDFCRRHEIDIFIPRLKMLDIAKEVERFDAIGTKVMVCRDIPLLESMLEKDRFYETLQGTGVVAIPEYYVVETADQFKTAYDTLVRNGHRVCFKPTDSEGGMGFRIIDNDMDPLANLYGWVSSSVPFEQAYGTLSAVEKFPKLMVMELLEEDEVSIDCLADPEGKLIVAIPRRKSSGRIYLLDDVPELMEIAEKVSAKCRIPYVFNIQVKYNKGVPKLLEINPRMSGGLFITCLSGVNMPYLAVKTIMGQSFERPDPRLGIKASYLELPIVMQGKG
ncbi:ATP-grasp domain-containing protein [Cohnella mopanensis]|uniref:ATP-grasp domain-containing protein n=1 Tax=Cohnella mopanensis TaxID=2911966 RepID=UPI001EF92BBF|nr:ATP-grasp domain-containing protein [Cohnella mopanensis]